MEHKISPHCEANNPRHLEHLTLWFANSSIFVICVSALLFICSVSSSVISTSSADVPNSNNDCSELISVISSNCNYVIGINEIMKYETMVIFNLNILFKLFKTLRISHFLKNQNSIIKYKEYFVILSLILNHWNVDNLLLYTISCSVLYSV